jgi:hypothetical protein
MDNLEKLKNWCIKNSYYQEGMDNDSGQYDSIEFLKLEDILDKINELTLQK